MTPKQSARRVTGAIVTSAAKGVARCQRPVPDFTEIQSSPDHCAKCGKKITNGRPGRSCRDCRVANPGRRN